MDEISRWGDVRFPKRFQYQAFTREGKPVYTAHFEILRVEPGKVFTEAERAEFTIDRSKVGWIEDQETGEKIPVLAAQPAR